MFTFTLDLGNVCRDHDIWPSQLTGVGTAKLALLSALLLSMTLDHSTPSTAPRVSVEVQEKIFDSLEGCRLTTIPSSIRILCIAWQAPEGTGARNEISNAVKHALLVVLDHFEVVETLLIVKLPRMEPRVLDWYFLDRSYRSTCPGRDTLYALPSCQSTSPHDRFGSLVVNASWNSRWRHLPNDVLLPPRLLEICISSTNLKLKYGEQKAHPYVWFERSFKPRNYTSWRSSYPPYLMRKKMGSALENENKKLRTMGYSIGVDEARFWSVCAPVVWTRLTERFVRTVSRELQSVEGECCGFRKGPGEGRGVPPTSKCEWALPARILPDIGPKRGFEDAVARTMGGNRVQNWHRYKYIECGHVTEGCSTEGRRVASAWGIKWLNGKLAKKDRLARSIVLSKESRQSKILNKEDHERGATNGDASAENLKDSAKQMGGLGSRAESPSIDGDALALELSIPKGPSWLGPLVESQKDKTVASNVPGRWLKSVPRVIKSASEKLPTHLDAMHIFLGDEVAKSVTKSA
ncbi:hypothetical protein FA13DRAFT_1720678 [Coprinellus micaceus]|uniref:Uncharacterized protein n=1 Tax=Coprinellus micaceus TaxID=71717 RepID=A0A4Y7S6W1_COPMI|nr:hypothetical protein FA13DRAFT_1720678 [Coprinellus micaceus]